MQLRDVIELGLNRKVPELLPDPPGLPVVSLGAGRKLPAGHIALDAERGWYAGEAMPFDNDSVGAFYAFHFLEHLTKTEIMQTLGEVARCLPIGGHLTMLTPHWSCEMAHQDLDHKSFWGETTWKNLCTRVCWPVA
jgi:predicted SAM-dependent methyltransferase